MSKKVLAIICAAGLLLGVCGSDKSDEKTKPVKPPVETTTPAPEPVAPAPSETAPPPVSNSKAKIYYDDLGITQDQFVSMYNAALTQLANDAGENYNNRKINFDNPKNVVKSKNGTTTHFYSGKYCSVGVHKNNSSSANICGVDVTINAGYKPSECLPELAAATFATTQSGQDFENVYKFVASAVKSGQNFATSIDGLIIYFDSHSGLMLFVEDATLGDGLGNRIVDNLRDRAKKGRYWSE